MTSSAEEMRWNKYSNTMCQFHDHFKDQFTMIYEVRLADRLGLGSYCTSWRMVHIRAMECRWLHTSSPRPSSTAVVQRTTEKEIFPKLAKRMPQFSADAEGHVEAHRNIHKGLKKLLDLVKKWKNDPKTYSPAEMKSCLDELQLVLFPHLDNEVSDLRGESLKKYFSSINELERELPWF